MALSEANRNRYRSMAQKLVPSGEVLDVAIARSGPDPVRTSAAIVASFVVAAIVFYVVTGGYFILGLIPFAVIQYFASPPRVVTVTDEGITVIARSFWTGRPNHSVGTYDRSASTPAGQSGRRLQVTIGDLSLWLTRGEEDRLRSAVARSLGGSTASRTTVGAKDDEPTTGAVATTTPARPARALGDREPVRTADLFPDGAYSEEGSVDAVLARGAGLGSSGPVDREPLRTKDLFPEGAYGDEVDLDEVVRSVTPAGATEPEPPTARPTAAPADPVPSGLSPTSSAPRIEKAPIPEREVLSMKDLFPEGALDLDLDELVRLAEQREAEAAGRTNDGPAPD